MQLIPINKETSKETWQAYYQVKAHLYALKHSKQWSKSFEYFIQSTLAAIIEGQTYACLLQIEEQPVGWLHAGYSNAILGKGFISATGAIINAFSNDVCASKVKAWLWRDANPKSMDKCTITVTDAYEKNFADLVGAFAIAEDKRCKLDMSKLDESLLNSWVTNAELSGLKEIIFENTIPENYIQQYADLNIAGFTDSPTNKPEYMYQTSRNEIYEKLDQARRQNKPYIIIALLEDDTMVGLTKLSYNHNGSTAQQGMTVINSAYRNRGLAKYLKARICLHLTRCHPNVKHITSGSLADNNSMLHINERAGFVYTHSVYWYQMN